MSSSSSSGGAYSTTARLLNEVWSTHRSLKTIVYDKDGQLTCSKATYALCTKVLAARSTLRAVLAQFPHLQQAVRNQGLLYAVVYELVAGPKLKIQGGGAVKRHVLRYEQTLRTAWEQECQATRLSMTRHTESFGETQENNNNQHDNDNGNDPAEFPRYLRINTLRTTTQAVLCYLQDELHLKSIRKDAHIPDLLVLPREATPVILQQSDKRYDWVLQDKSSCFSAYCLVHGFVSDTNNSDNNYKNMPRRVYLDACAAPGNKTTHLAALVAATTAAKQQKQPVQIHALDRSPVRFQSLQTRVQQHMMTLDDNDSSSPPPLVQVHTSCSDFLTTSSDNDTYAAVTDILLDPSCSGSGIFARHTTTTLSSAPHHTASDEDRLTALAQFQTTALQHALTNFSNVQRVVYSTCSLHVQENEGVVAAVLKACGHDWRLVAPACLATWKRRGVVTAGLTPEQAASLIRVDRPDQTNGFFVSCWERIQHRHRGENTNGSVVKKKSAGGASITSTIENTKPETTARHYYQSSYPPSDIKTNSSRYHDAQPKKKQKDASENTNAKREPVWVKQSGKKKKRKKR